MAHLNSAEGIQNMCATQIMTKSKSLRTGFKSNQITFIVTSPQHKCLGEWNSYERAPDSAKKNNNKQFTYGQTVQKKTTTTIYIWTDSAKKQQQQFTYGQTVQKNNKQFTYGQTVQKKKINKNLHMDRQCKKAALEHLQCSRQCKKTTTIYIWTGFSSQVAH